MARRYFNALKDKIKKTKERIEQGTATLEDIEWLRKVEEQRRPKPKYTINLNPGKEEPRKRNKTAAVSIIQRYRRHY